MTDNSKSEYLPAKGITRRDFLKLAATASLSAFIAACEEGKKIPESPTTLTPAKPAPTEEIAELLVELDPIEVIKEVNENKPSIFQVQIPREGRNPTTIQIANLHPTDRKKIINPELIIRIDSLLEKVLPNDIDRKFAFGDRMIVMWDVNGQDMFKGKNPIRPQIGAHPLTVTYDNAGNGYHITFLPVDYSQPQHVDHIEGLSTEWCQGYTAGMLNYDGPADNQIILKKEKLCNEFGIAMRFAGEGVSYDIYTTFLNQNPIVIPGVGEFKGEPYTPQIYQEMVNEIAHITPIIEFK